MYVVQIPCNMKLHKALSTLATRQVDRSILLTQDVSTRDHIKEGQGVAVGAVVGISGIHRLEQVPDVPHVDASLTDGVRLWNHRQITAADFGNCWACHKAWTVTVSCMHCVSSSTYQCQDNNMPLICTKWNKLLSRNWIPLRIYHAYKPLLN